MAGRRRKARARERRALSETSPPSRLLARLAVAVDDAPWLIGLTVFDSSTRTWRRLGLDLEDAARTGLTGQAQVEVEGLARRLHA